MSNCFGFNPNPVAVQFEAHNPIAKYHHSIYQLVALVRSNAAFAERFKHSITSILALILFFFFFFFFS